MDPRYILVCIPAAYLVACCLPAIWLAFGRSHFVLRTVFFLFSAILLGLLPRYFFGRPPILVGQVLVGSAVIAASLAGMRWLDFRLVSLASGINREQFERGTGKTIDEWIRELNARNASAWPLRQLQAYLHNLIQTDDWVEAIVKAYEISIGRIEVERTDTGEALYIVPIRANGIGPFITSMQEQRLSIKQLLFASVFVALLFSVIRAIPYDWLDGRHVSAVMLLSVVFSIVTLFVTTSSLSIKGPTWRSWALGLLTLGVGFTIAKLIGLTMFLQRISGVPFISETVFVLATIASVEMLLALMLVRQNGYRLVTVRRKGV